MKTNQKFRAAAGRQSRAFKLKSLVVFTLFLLFNAVWAQNQQRKWFQNSKDIDFTTVPPTAATTAGVNNESIGSQKATNGVHAHNNDRIFNINGTKLYAPYSSSSVYFSIFPAGSFEYLGAEVCIVPKPGSCDSFYVFYSHKHYHEGQGCDAYELSYHLVDRNLLIPPNPDYAVVESGQVFYKDLSVTCPPPSAMAAGKEKLVNGVKTRQLFYTDFDGMYYSIKRVNITYAGISSSTTIYTHTNGLDLQTYELELSPDGSKLALGRCRFGFAPPEPHPDKDVVIYHLDSNGALNTGLGNGGLTYIDIPTGNLIVESIAGLEFNSASNRLFASRGNDGIYYIDNITGLGTPSINAIANTANYSFSQMEAVYNDGVEYIAVAKNENEVHRILNVSTTPTISSSYFFNNTNVPRLSESPVSYGIGQNVHTQYLYSLPDQVDGDNYTGSAGGWFDPNNSTKCCMNFYVPNGTDHLVEGTQTWTPINNPFGVPEPVFVGDLTIAEGATLTLQGITLRFQPTARVVIRRANGQTPAGRLNLVSSTLTGLACDLTWRGVRIIGNPTLPHLAVTHQGYLNMNVASVISNAEVAIATWDKEASDFSTSGGVAQVANSNFTNNHKDVEVVRYPQPGFGPFSTYNFFDLCNFTINNNYLFSTINHRATVAQFKDVRFKGCLFANDNTSFQSSSLNNIAGIFAFDASFSVTQSTINPSVRGRFRKLFRGIHVTRLFANEAYVVQQNDFEQNQTGILSEGINNFVVNGSNVFSIGGNANFGSNIGLVINTGSGFNVRDNTFNGIQGGSVRTFGCIARNTNLAVDDDNTIYRNTFYALNVANQSEGYNRRSSDQAGGLYYFCNSQSQNGYDIRVLPDNTYTDPWQGIKAVQGLNISGQLRAAQNTFTHTSQPAMTDLYNDPNSSLIQNLVYYWDVAANDPFCSPAPPKVTRTQGVTKNCASGNPYLFSIADFDANGFEAASYEEAKQDYLSAKYLHELLIDNGNKQTVKNGIDFGWSADAWTLRNHLLALSPNLSEEMLLHAAQKNILPPALLFEVCYANLRSSRSPVFLEKLESGFATTLPSYMLDILKSAEEPQTYRKTIEEQYATASAQLSGSYQQLLSLLMLDSLDRRDLIVQLLEDVPLISAKLSLVDAYKSKGRTADAQVTIATLRNAYPDDTPLQQELDMAMFALERGNSLTGLTESDVSFLTPIAQNAKHAGFVQANNILRVFGLSQYNFEPLEITPSSFKTEYVQSSAVNSSSSFVNMKLYPNPAKDFVTIELQNVINNTLTAEVTDYQGRVLLSTILPTFKTGRIVSNISISDLQSGSYIINILDGKLSLATKSFTKTN